jgi:hypothetical protein
MRRAYAMTLFAFAACTGDIVTSDTGQQVGGIVTNGESLNGESLNGSGLGNAVAWASFANVKNGNLHFDDMWIEGSELVARKNHGKARGVYRGAALQGAVVQARSDIDRHVALRISKVVAPDPGDDKWQYGIEFQFKGSWFPLCLADALTGEGLNGPSLNGDELNQGIEDGSILSLDAVPVTERA